MSEGERTVTRRKVRISETRPTKDEDADHSDRWGDAAVTTEGEIEETESSRIRFVRRKSRKELERIHFQMVNDRVVEDITIDALYKPHTLTILLLLCSFLIYKAVTGTVAATDRNIYDGLLGTLALFLVVSALAFPNGPFIRPHPVLWRIIFGLSVVYLMILQFTLFQTYEDVKKVLTWLDPKGLGAESLNEKDYAINCSDVSLARIWSHCDIFAVGHFLGWAMKALLIRHSILCWYISISWELTEIVFTNMLPNFAECWWDALILDVLLCNGLGIWFGLQVCKFFDAKEFHWESIKEAEGHRAKIKRAVLQFTPESWTKNEWFGSTALKRTLAVYLFVMIWLATELNTFFMKHVFAIDTKHPVVFWRLILVAWISAPSIRQYYTYATDPLVKRLGMQCWVYCAITALEAAICMKFGRDMFPMANFGLVAVWLLFLVVGTWVSIWISVWWAYTPFADTKEITVEGETRRIYLDSSHENLGAIHDDVRRRRRSLGFSESDVY